jgi:hypothetical protein
MLELSAPSDPPPRRLDSVPRIVRYKIEGGRNFGVPRVVLARRGPRELWWWGRRDGWSTRRKKTVRLRSELVLYVPVFNHLNDIALFLLHQGGHMSEELFLRHADAIDQFFGIPGLTTHITPERTLLVDG